jgi:hypothetical protein
MSPDQCLDGLLTFLKDDGYLKMLHIAKYALAPRPFMKFLLVPNARVYDQLRFKALIYLDTLTLGYA